MPVWLSLFGAVSATVGLFVTVFLGIVVLIELRRLKAKPRIGLATGSVPGSINVWVDWDANQFAMQIYRLRISHVSPGSKIKEGTFTVTFENPQTMPFAQPILMPDAFKNMLERDANERSLLSFEFRTIDEMSISTSCTLKKAKKIFSGLANKTTKLANILPALGQDVATVFSLDFSELQERKKRMKELEAAAKAKAAKAPPPKPAAAPAAPAAAATPATPAPAPTPAPVAAAATPAAPVADKPASATPPKSVRDVVSATNKSQGDKVGDK